MTLLWGPQLLEKNVMAKPHRESEIPNEEAEEAEPTTSRGVTPEQMVREVVSLVGTLIEEAVAANKRPFYVSAKTAQRLTFAIDEFVEDIINEDGTIDGLNEDDEEAQEKLEAKLEKLKTLLSVLQ